MPFRSTQDSTLIKITSYCSRVNIFNSVPYENELKFQRGNRIRDEGLIHVGEAIAELPNLE